MQASTRPYELLESIAARCRSRVRAHTHMRVSSGLLYGVEAAAPDMAIAPRKTNQVP